MFLQTYNTKFGLFLDNAAGKLIENYFSLEINDIINAIFCQQQLFKRAYFRTRDPHCISTDALFVQHSMTIFIYLENTIFRQCIVS